MDDPGEKALDILLSTLTATLDPKTYVFVTTTSLEMPPLPEIQLLFREEEGITVIIGQEYAEANDFPYLFPSRMITLDVMSSLDAVGFMAVVAMRLAAKDMGVNPVSGFYHDHLFVPLGREEEAMEELKLIAEERRDFLSQSKKGSEDSETSS